MDELVDRVSGNEIISMIDVHSRYNQILMLRKIKKRMTL